MASIVSDSVRGECSQSAFMTIHSLGFRFVFIHTSYTTMRIVVIL